jgi:hypothetical protein
LRLTLQGVLDLTLQSAFDLMPPLLLGAIAATVIPFRFSFPDGVLRSMVFCPRKI